ncbi:MAG: nicotinate-nucleotide--dimethylbenzimidazole phosphoribosyltransferase [Actinobacteria bacterium]|nr:nicotinate-nucleotide--dimethylbenzimidazole phosphoribosyltransferase [Actinomycetota bacterium]
MTFDLQALVDRIGLPDDAARAAAEARQRELTKPTGALGRLEDLSVWLCGVQGACPPRPLDRVRVVVLAGDHGVARTAMTSAYPPEVTAQMVLNFLAGGAAVNVLARQNGASVRVVDVSVDVDWAELGAAVPDDVVRGKVRRGSGSIDREDAMTREQAEAALELGVRIADEEVDSGADLLIPGDMGIGNTTPAAVITGLYTGKDAASVVGRGTGIDDLAWMRKTAAVRDAMRRGREHRADAVGLLAAVGGPDIAAMTGLLLGAAARRTPVLLDGVVSCAAALVAQRIAFRTREWFLAGHLSTEPAAAAALERLRLDPVVDYGLRLGEGTGALVALPVLAAAGATLREMATFAEAGVSDREDGPDDGEPDAGSPAVDAG